MTDRKEYMKKYYQENRERLLEYNKNQKNKPELRERKNRNAAKYRKQLREKVDAIKLEKGCIDCGYNKNPRALEFDHVKGEKLETVGKLVADNRSWKTIQEEIEKCVVRCRNCHAIKTWVWSP